jgi:mannose-1-phosphate guanylyltransferase
MKAILLAAGYGTRLKPLTDYIPKCLVNIGGVPLLEIWLSRLTAVNVTDFLINTHYLSDQVSTFAKNSLYESNITLTHENFLLGTAGTLMANLDFFEGKDGMLIHADNYCLEDLNDFIAAHLNRPEGCLISMMTFKTIDKASSGMVELDSFNRVTNFYEKQPNAPGDYANGAVYILSSEFIEIAKTSFMEAKDFSLDVIPRLLNRIFAYKCKNTFLDIGTSERYLAAQNLS